MSQALKTLTEVLLLNAARRKQTNGKFLLVMKERLQRRVVQNLKKQLKWTLRAIVPLFEKNAIQKNFSRSDANAILEKMPNQADIAEDIVASMELTLNRGAKTTIAKFALTRFGIGFEVVNKRASAFLGEKLSHELSQKKGTIHATTVERINELLLEAQVKGWSYQETSKRIQEQGETGVFSQARGELIATREVGIAYEKGNNIPLAAFAEENPDRKVQKFWQTVEDSRVTKPHKENEQMGWIAFTETFTGTGDEHAPGSDNPRCRCSTLYRIT